VSLQRFTSTACRLSRSRLTLEIEGDVPATFLDELRA